MSEKKNQLAEALLETWKISDEINVAVGLTTDSDEQLPHQIEVAFGEFKEGVQAIKDFNEEEIYDAICDLNVTVIPCAMMYAGNKSLLDEPHPYELNPEGKDFNELIHDAQREFLSTKYGVRHFASCVDYVCDLSAASNIDQDKMIKYLNSVNKSNLSKFPEVGSVDPENECELIEEKGRYTDVYFEESELLGKKVYIFKSNYDKKNNERFTNGKYLKPSCFKEPLEFM